MLVREIAEALALRFEGDGNTTITGVAPLDAAGPNQISFAGGRKAFDSARQSAAGCLIVPPDFEDTTGRTLIRADQPRAAFAAAVKLLHPPPSLRPGVHPTAVIRDGAHVDSGAEIAPHA